MAETSTAQEDFTLTYFLRPHARKIREALVGKIVTVPGLEEAEKVLKNANQDLFKAAKHLGEPSKIEDAVKQLVIMAHGLKAVKTSSDSMITHVEKCYAVELGKTRTPLGQIFMEIENSTKAPNVESHEFWKKYQQAVAASSKGLADDDVVVEDPVDDEVRFVDPVTKTIMTNPVINKQCNHRFDSTTADDLLTRPNARCPVRGCKKNIRREDLVEDANLKYEIEMYLKKTQKAAGNAPAKAKAPATTSGRKKHRVKSEDENDSD